jgi:WD40 repeat protein
MRPAILILLVASALRAEPPALDPYGDHLPEGAVSRIGSSRNSRSEAHEFAITSDGSRFISRTNTTLVVRDTRTLAEVRKIRVSRNGLIKCAAISADGRRVAAVGLSTILSGNPLATDAAVWDVATGEQLYEARIEKGEHDPVLALSSDGKRLATLGCVIDVDGKRVEREIPLTRRANHLEFVAGDKYLLVNASKNWFCWEADTGKEVRCESDTPKALESERHFAPDGKSLFYVEAADLVRMTAEFPTPDRPTVKFGSPKRFPVGEKVGIERVSEKGDRCLLLRPPAERGPSLLLFETDAGKVVDELAVENDTLLRVHASGLTGKGALLVVRPGYYQMSGVDLAAVEMPGGKNLTAEQGLKFLDSELTWMPDGKRLRSKKQLWDARTGEYLRAAKPDDSPPEKWQRPPAPQGGHSWQIAHSDGNLAVVMLQLPVGKTFNVAQNFPDPPGEPQVWDTAANRKLHPLRVKESRHLASLNVRGLSGDGRVFAQDDRHELFVWETRNGRLIAQEKLDATPLDLHYTLPLMGPTGRQLVCAPKGRLVLFDIASRNAALELKLDVPPDQWVPDLDWSPDGRFVALLTRDGELQVYDLHRAKLAWKKATGQNGPRAVRFSPDGRWILTQDNLHGLVWPAPEVEPVFQPLKEKELPAAWDRLLSRSAAECREACLRLAASGEAAAKFLDGKLEADIGLTAERFAALLSRLRDDDFRRRNAAEKELRELDDAAVPRLEKVLAAGPTDADLTERVGRLIQATTKLTAPPHSAETLRKLRGIVVLEAIRTASSRKTLERLANGAEESAVTREARAALKRTE